MLRSLLIALSLTLLGMPAYAAPELDQARMVSILKDLDQRQRAVGDFTARAFLKRSEKGKEDVVYEALFYRRGQDRKFMFLVLAPKTEAGGGYLRIDGNLWMYTPSIGKWERLTERDRILGSDGRRQDFDESRLAEEYHPSYIGEGSLGKYKTWRLRLEAKPGVDVAWPILEIDIDQESGNLLKQLDFALSGKLMRRSLFPKWLKVSDSSGKAVWYAEQMFFYDEVDKGNSSVMKIEEVDLSPLPANIFTKAWLESKSR